MHSRYTGECYGMLLRRSAGAITEIYNETLRPLGLTLAQYSLLANLEYYGQMNIKQWADMVGLERTTMVRNIRTLQARGWIKEAEGKGKQFVLSESGLKTFEEAHEEWVRAQKKIEKILGKVNCAAIVDISVRLQNEAVEISEK